MKPNRIALLALCALMNAVHAAEESQPAVASPIELYKGPKGIALEAPPYPFSERQQGGEGWVIVNMMIDPNGKPYEATVVESTGNPVFEKAALAAVEKWRFEPATVNGTPIDAGGNYKLQFQLSGETGAKEPFVRAYKQLLAAVEAGDRERADSRLALLKPHNLYEDAYAGLAYYGYYRKWGTAAQQLSAIRRAIAGEKHARYLPKGAFTQAQQTAMALEIETGDYARALRTWAALRDNIDPEQRTRMQKSVDQIEALRTGDKAFYLDAEITMGSSWYYELLKQRFQINVTSGKVAEIKLRCDQQYVFFRYDPALQYTIKGNSRGCWMEVVGDPGTKFQLVQL
ncbi:MAG TPA: energy transducer TonB [Steroidobacteraceae bacterium]|nr:energy transducer TonB [Steroidobacteraceae bacterium]